MFAYGEWEMRIPDAIWRGMDAPVEKCYCPVRTALREAESETSVTRMYDALLRTKKGPIAGIVSEEEAKAAFLMALDHYAARGSDVTQERRIAHMLGWLGIVEPAWEVGGAL